MTEKQSVSREVQAHRDVQDAVDKLKIKYPKAGLSFGYIGNFERWGDDRAFYIFSAIPMPRNERLRQHWSHWKTMRWGGYAAKHGGIHEMLRLVNGNLEAKIQTALKQQAAKLARMRGEKQ